MRLPDVETVTLDALDRRIVHALVIEPRAPFRTLSDAVGASAQTVARRYRLLQERASLRVVGRVDGFRVGWVRWYVRIRCAPSAAEAVAGALAQRPDTSWVVLASGGTEIVCGLQARTSAERDALLLQGLAGSRRVTQLAAHQLLHDYSLPAWGQLTRELSESELDRLHPQPADGPDPAVDLGADDEVLLDQLAVDGRATHASLAAATGWHESTVRRRIQQLRRNGVLGFDVDIDTSAVGVTTQTMLWISVAPAHLDAAGAAIAGHPEVPFVAATTGPSNLMATVLSRDTAHLYTYLTHRLAAVQGIHSADSSPLIRVVKRSGPLRRRQRRRG